MQVVESDLRLISVESRKKWPRVKEAAERGILWAHSYRGADKGTRDLTQILLPLILCLETGDEKLVVYGLSALQKLLSHSFVPPEEISRFLAKMEELARAGFEQAHLKVLQTIVTLLSTTKLSDIDLNKALTICFILHERGASSVGNIASASLRQCLTMLLDAEQLEMVRAILQDLCALALGDPALWLVSLPTLEQAFCLEMVETIIAHPATGTHAATLEQVKTSVCPMVHRVLQIMDQQQTDGKTVRLTLRVLRIVRTLLASMASTLVAETEVLVTKVARWLNEDGNDWTWHHAVLLEVVLAWAATPGWLAAVFANYDLARSGDGQGASVFGLLLRSVARVAQLTWRWASSDMADVGAGAGAGAGTGGLLDAAQHAQGLPPWALGRPRLTRLLVDCCQAVAAALRDAPPQLRGAMVGAGWPPLMGALAALMGKVAGTGLLEGCVNSLVDVLRATVAVAAGDVSREAVVQALIKACEENEAGKRLTHLKICVDGLQVGVRAVQGQLSTAAWFGVLHVLLRSADPAGDVLTEEGADALLAAPPSSLWTDCAALADAGLAQLVAALSRLCAEALQDSTLTSERRCWPANRLCALLLLCASRAQDASRQAAVAALWADASELLLAVCNHASAALRAQGLLSVHAMCTRGCGFDCSMVASLELLRAMGLSLYGDVRLTAVRGVEHCARGRGHLLGARGWTPVLHAVSEAASHGKRDEVVRGFAVLQLIVEELLPDLGSADNLLILVHAIGCYALQDSDSNASLTTPALVWSLAHHIMNHLSPAEFAPLWEPLLKLLTASARDATREEVRAGGLRTLFKMVELYFNQWPPDLWQSCCTNVFVPMLEQLTVLGPRIVAPSKTMSEGWLSTLALAATGCATLPAGPGLRTATRDLVLAALAAPVAFAPTPQRPRAAVLQLLASYGALLETGAGVGAEDWRALQAPLTALLGRAQAEAAELESPQGSGVGSTSTARFSHYFVLCDVLRTLMQPRSHYHGPEDVAVAAALLCDVVRLPALYSDATYRQAGILYDPQYKPHTTPPLITYTAAALQAQLQACPTEAGAWAALALQAAHGVQSLCATLRAPLTSLLARADGAAFPTLPADPDPCLLQPDLRRSCVAALRELGALSAPCPLGAVPLLAHVLGCLLQLADEEVASGACSVYVSLCEGSVTPLRSATTTTTNGSSSSSGAASALGPLLRCLIDVAERSLLTSLEANLVLGAKCAAVLSGPLRSSAATEALLAVCRSSGASASVALAQLLLLVPHSPLAAEQALVHCSSVLSGGNPPAHLLHALRQLRLPRSAWPSSPSKLPADDGRGLTHLLLLYHALVDAASSAAAPAESRRLAALCLHDAASSLGLPPQ